MEGGMGRDGQGGEGGRGREMEEGWRGGRERGREGGDGGARAKLGFPPSLQPLPPSHTVASREGRQGRQSLGAPEWKRPPE